MMILSLSSDDRFILKQMPRLEVQSFLDFAPNYFTYITGAVQQKVGVQQHCFSWMHACMFVLRL